ncbi:UNVERIFIED_CONTAM: Auxin-repressed protein [Sesamum angustifolium]|uniref:Auxin-repressed protein n=1 Tax=Sesamum angustifolium TaxID=2727405 RepID=A0AAW2PDP7_9LAMI
MVLLDQLWDDVVAGPQPERGLKHLKKVFTTPLDVKDGGEGSIGKYQRSQSMPSSPTTPGTPTSPTTAAARRDNVWRSVFNPGSNLATKNVGSEYFDKPQPNSPTVYDWYTFDLISSRFYTKWIHLFSSLVTST